MKPDDVLYALGRNAALQKLAIAAQPIPPQPSPPGRIPDTGTGKGMKARFDDAGDQRIDALLPDVAQGTSDDFLRG